MRGPPEGSSERRPARGDRRAIGTRFGGPNRGGAGVERLQEVAGHIVAEANQKPGLAQVYSTFRADTPQFYADIDRTKARMLNVPMDNVLKIYLGSLYVNDFNFLGRTYQVTAQADSPYRDEESDISRLRTRSSSGEIVPLGSLVEVERITAPDRVVRYNLYPAADVNGNTTPGYSSGQSLETMEKIADEISRETGLAGFNRIVLRRAVFTTTI